MRVSVFVTSYNQKAFLAEAIESVLSQTLLPSQIIVVDDCSQDGSQEVIAGYASRYRGLITPIYHDRNLGVANVRVHALQAVTGDYVTYVDGDDRYLPRKLEREAAALQTTPSARIAFSNSYYLTADGTRTGLWADGEIPPQGEVFRQTFSRDFPRRSLFRMELVEYSSWKAIGFHDTDLALYEDFDMRIRLTKHCQAVYCDEPLSEIRQHQFGLSNAEARSHLAAVDQVWKKNRHLLADLRPVERREVQRRLREWMASMAKRAAEQALARGEATGRLRALRYYLLSLRYQPGSFDHRFALRLLLPSRVYSSAAAIYRGLTASTEGGPR